MDLQDESHQPIRATKAPGTTTAKTHDRQVWDEILDGKETSVWADKGYVPTGREAAFTKGGDPFGSVSCARLPRAVSWMRDEKINGIIAKVRTKVEHPFRVIKLQFDHVKTRYRGLAKNRAHLFKL